MVFSSPIFLFCFLPIVYIVDALLPKVRLKNAFLSVASLLFYSFGQPVYTLLLLLGVLINYASGCYLMGNGKCRRFVLALAVAGDLLILGIFKYTDFVIDCINGVSGSAIPLTGIILPIGISFYTFQGLSYVIDVYRDAKQGTRRLDKLLLYIAFFPQLIAGPIIQYHDISQQIDARRVTPEQTLSGLARFIGGLGKKVLLANTAGAMADAVFSMNGGAMDARIAWLGAVCYTLQIYFDFSGYSDMAIGTGRLLGFRIKENFNLPYTADSVRGFWRRWHISLSSWFRDYLYIPLGGNRKGKWRTTCNKFAVFFATGLWHGANWTFVFWGLWHGIMVTLEDRKIFPRFLRRPVVGHIYTMLTVVLAFVLFRADTLPDAWTMYVQMFTNFQFTAEHTLTLMDMLTRRNVCLILVGILFSVGLPQRVWSKVEWNGKGILCAVGYGVLFLLCILELSGATYDPFIYFQF